MFVAMMIMDFTIRWLYEPEIKWSVILIEKQLKQSGIIEWDMKQG